MSGSGQIRAVLFDYGGVLTSPVRAAFNEWEVAHGLPEEAARSLILQWMRSTESQLAFHQLETGRVGLAEVDRQLREQLGTGDDFTLADMFGRLRDDDDAYRLAHALVEAGIAVGVLSNSWDNPYPWGRFEGLFDPVLISGELGLRKPDPAIFELALTRLGLPAEQVAFIDDTASNVRAADAAGLIGVLHTDTASTAVRLAHLIPHLRFDDLEKP